MAWAARLVFGCLARDTGVESLVDHPAIMTHASVPAYQRKVLGISDTLIRLSCGIENGDDVSADMEHAMKAVKSVTGVMLVSSTFERTE